MDTSKYDLVIENASALTLDNQNNIIENCVICIKDGFIAAIEQKTENCTYTADEHIDAHGMIALPGFINTHVHCFQSLLKGLGADLPLIGWLKKSVQPFGVKVTHGQQELSALLACLEAIKSGCTTLCEFFYTNQDPELADVCIETMKSTGIRSVFMRTFQDDSGDFFTPDCYLEPVSKAIQEVERLKKTYPESDMLSIWTGPDVPWATTKKAYEEILEYCLDRKVRYTMHLKETPDDDNAAFRHYGKSTIELLSEIGFLTDQLLAVHCVYLTPDEIKLLSERGVSISHIPAANLYLGSGIAPIPACLDAGINVTLGTDGAASNNTTDMLDTMRLTALIHKGVSKDATAMRAEKVIKMATKCGASAIGMGDLLGTLEAGKKADIVLLDPDHLKSTPIHDPMATICYSASEENVDTTIVNGKIVYRKGVFSCGITEEELAERVRKELAKDRL